MKDIVFDDFRNWMCDRFINSQSRRSAKLSPTYLLTHESGIVGDVINQIDRTVWSKSSFDLYSDRIKDAELLFYVNDYKKTQHYYIQAIKKDKLSIKNIILNIICLMPKNIARSILTIITNQIK